MANITCSADTAKHTPIIQWVNDESSRLYHRFYWIEVQHLGPCVLTLAGMRFFGMQNYFKGLKALADETNQTKRTVQIHIDRLIKEERIKRIGREWVANGGIRRNTTYQIEHMRRDAQFGVFPSAYTLALSSFADRMIVSMVCAAAMKVKLAFEHSDVETEAKNGDDVFRLTERYISSQANLDRKTVKASLKRLSDAKFIRVEGSLVLPYFEKD